MPTNRRHAANRLEDCLEEYLDPCRPSDALERLAAAVVIACELLREDQAVEQALREDVEDLTEAYEETVRERDLLKMEAVLLRDALQNT